MSCHAATALQGWGGDRPRRLALLSVDGVSVIVSVFSKMLVDGQIAQTNRLKEVLINKPVGSITLLNIHPLCSASPAEGPGNSRSGRTFQRSLLLSFP